MISLEKRKGGNPALRGRRANHRTASCCSIAAMLQQLWHRCLWGHRRQSREPAPRPGRRQSATGDGASGPQRDEAEGKKESLPLNAEEHEFKKNLRRALRHFAGLVSSSCASAVSSRKKRGNCTRGLRCDHSVAFLSAKSSPLKLHWERLVRQRRKLRQLLRNDDAASGAQGASFNPIGVSDPPKMALRPTTMPL